MMGDATFEMKMGKLLQLVFGVACLAFALWSVKLTAYNWWAAGGPPVKNAAEYAARGNAFAVATLVLLVAGVVLIVRVFRRSSTRET
jgi:hypothetical protein